MGSGRPGPRRPSASPFRDLYDFLTHHKNIVAVSKNVYTGCVFSEHAFFYERARLAPCELTHVRASHLATVRRAGRKRGARFESTEALVPE